MLRRDGEVVWWCFIHERDEVEELRARRGGSAQHGPLAATLTLKPCSLLQPHHTSRPTIAATSAKLPQNTPNSILDLRATSSREHPYRNLPFDDERRVASDEEAHTSREVLTAEPAPSIPFPSQRRLIRTACDHVVFDVAAGAEAASISIPARRVSSKCAIPVRRTAAQATAIVSRSTITSKWNTNICKLTSWIPAVRIWPTERAVSV